MRKSGTTQRDVSNGLLTKAGPYGDTPERCKHTFGGKPMDSPHKITVLRGDVCIEGDTCPMIACLDDDLETLHMVVTPETDPAKIAVFASRIGPGELLARFPAALLPVVT